jgi:hypothetical protein
MKRHWLRAVFATAIILVTLVAVVLLQHHFHRQQLARHTKYSYVTLQSWGVRFKAYAPLTGVQVVVNGDTAGFTATELTRFDQQCGPQAVPFEYPLGALQRSHTSLQLAGGRLPNPIAHVGAYYYYFTPPEAHCFLSPSTDTAWHEQRLEELLSTMPDSLASLEAAP